MQILGFYHRPIELEILVKDWVIYVLISHSDNSDAH